MKRIALALILALALTASLFAGAALAEEGGTFVYARADSVTSFDLHQEITMNNAFAIDKVFEPLVLFDTEGVITDYLAASHTISDDGLVYTFVLRDGLKFSDGTDVTAEDVKFSLERHLAVEGPLPLEADIASIEAADEKTVVITLNQAYTPFFSELANFSNGILPKDFGGRTEEEFFKNPVGTGPFVVSQWDPAGDLTFVKNEYYWQEGKPYIDTLVYKVIDDDNQAINQLKVGDVDAVEELTYANAAEIESYPETFIITRGSWNVEELFFNTLDEHFSDVHVRRALALALDREALAQALTFGYGQVANSVLPANLHYSATATVNALNLDLKAAQEELAQSAFPEGFSTTISIASGNNVRMQEALIVQAAGASIGIDIQPNPQEIATFRQDFRNLNYAIMINSATADFPDADSIFAFQVDPEGFSQCYWTSYVNEEAVALMKAGQVEPDGDGRAEIYAQLQQILADDVPYIPLYYPSILVGVRSNVEGLVILPNGTADFTGVVKK
ncbi:MAG: ABC transporter substrate-binding protein [Clostridia bacterium]|nr:ABC transporter substrate-binding protein [Clostridia bacterium]